MMSDATCRTAPKPKVLVLGGCGYIGRNLVQHLVENELASFVRVVDKVLPIMAYFHPSIESLFENPRVQFIQGDLTNQCHVNRAFETTFNGEQVTFDVVFNAAGETRPNQDSAMFLSRCRDLPILCARASINHMVNKFVEISTGFVYKSHSRTPPQEDEKPVPWGKQAEAKREAEIELLKINGIDIVIVRPAIIYGGHGDINGVLFGRIVCASCYAEGAGSEESKSDRLGHEMSLMWDAHMKINTVHITDVIRALWCVYTAAPPRSIWNLCDQSDTDQGKFGRILEEIFHIKIDYFGSFRSNVARLRLKDLAEMANEKHLQPWGDTCRRYGVFNTPLSPLVSPELLDHYNCFLNGTAIEEKLHFSYHHPVMTIELVIDSIRKAVEANIFPNVTVGGGSPLIRT